MHIFCNSLEASSLWHGPHSVLKVLDIFFAVPYGSAPTFLALSVSGGGPLVCLCLFSQYFLVFYHQMWFAVPSRGRPLSPGGLLLCLDLLSCERPTGGSFPQNYLASSKHTSLAIVPRPSNCAFFMVGPILPGPNRRIFLSLPRASAVDYSDLTRFPLFIASRAAAAFVVPSAVLSCKERSPRSGRSVHSFRAPQIHLVPHPVPALHHGAPALSTDTPLAPGAGPSDGEDFVSVGVGEAAKGRPSGPPNQPHRLIVPQLVPFPPPPFSFPPSPKGCRVFVNHDRGAHSPCGTTDVCLAFFVDFFFFCDRGPPIISPLIGSGGAASRWARCR